MILQAIIYTIVVLALIYLWFRERARTTDLRNEVLACLSGYEDLLTDYWNLQRKYDENTQVQNYEKLEQGFVEVTDAYQTDVLAFEEKIADLEVEIVKLKSEPKVKVVHNDQDFKDRITRASAEVGNLDL